MLLSIVIPTYNRYEHLNNLLKELECFKDFGEVIVSDNDSEKKINAAEYPYIRYYCNQRNVGFSKNIIISLSHVNTQYVWFIGDDDKIKIKNYKNLIDRLDKDIDHLLMCKTINNNFNYLDANNVKYFDDKLGFISMNIYRTEYLKQLILNCNNMYLLKYAAYHAIFKNKNNINIYNENCVVQNTENPSYFIREKKTIFNVFLLDNYLISEKLSKAFDVKSLLIIHINIYKKILILKHLYKINYFGLKIIINAKFNILTTYKLIILDIVTFPIYFITNAIYRRNK